MRSRRDPPADPTQRAPGGADWVSDPRFFADARLLAALHRDLRERLGPAAAANALLRAGFVHGLRDAIRARSNGARPSAPLLALRFTPGAGAGAVYGSWPEAIEARALRSLGGSGCWLSAGYTSGWLSGLGESDVLAIERGCAADGDGGCRFEARDAAAWRASGERAALAALDALPFAALRDDAQQELDEAAPTEDAGAVDPESPAVHVWGPVMVVPYAGADTAVAVQAVTREPAAAGVTVVVVDFEGACVDDGFGSVALERAIDAIESHGAEAVIAGLSPLAAQVVAALGRAELVVRDDLRAAIATAFQIAESQRHAT